MQTQGGQGRGRRQGGGRRGTTCTRNAGFVAVASAYVAEDLRKADGVTRSTLRRTAISLADSRHTVLRRMASLYLRADPPPEGRAGLYPSADTNVQTRFTAGAPEWPTPTRLLLPPAQRPANED